MDTTTAARQAGVTVATIRTWCRRNAVAAVKRAGRWIVDTASLARRISIGKERTMTQALDPLDLTATYTYDRSVNRGPLGLVTEPHTVHVTVKERQVADRNNGASIRQIRVTGLAPLFADRLDAIPAHDRGHVVTLLEGASVVLRDTPRDMANNTVGAASRRGGRVVALYQGDRHLPVDVLMDVAERLHDQLIG